MKYLRLVTFIAGLFFAVIAFGFVFRLPFATALWPWEDGRYSYLFIGSIFAAISVAALWVGWTGEFGALPAGAFNVFIIGLTTSIHFFSLASTGRPNLIPYAVIAALVALTSLVAFFWSLRIPLKDATPMPRLVKISFWVFIVSLFLAGSALILQAPIFPWALKPETSVIFGCIFLGDAFYFLYGMFRPAWHNALGQLLSFLAYDLVLIFPFLGLLNTIEPGRLVNLLVYTAVLLYSAALAIYYLFINPNTRILPRKALKREGMLPSS